MTNLERLALLGDKEAQKECTEKGILLPCPICKGKASVKHHPEWGWSQYEVFCENCGLSFNIAFSEPKDAIKAWNTRQAPPIGRCEECGYRHTEDCAMYYECDYCRPHYDKSDLTPAYRPSCGAQMIDSEE